MNYNEGSSVLLSLSLLATLLLSQARPNLLPSQSRSLTSQNTGVKLAPPLRGVYHGAYTDFGGLEETVTLGRLTAFERLVGKRIVWAYFSNNWSRGIVFPTQTVKIIHRHGIVPFIRIIPRSGSAKDELPDPVFTMQRIIDGEFDEPLRAWARAARATPIPLLVEFGTEVNADWFPWNARYNGADKLDGYGNPGVPDGAERFRDAYRHIIRLCREEGAYDITWVYHVLDPALAAATSEDAARALSSSLSAYYPGDEYIDWIGISVYGPQKPLRVARYKRWRTFAEIMDVAYPELAAISASKPLAVLEFGVVDDAGTGDKAEWIGAALRAIKAGRYPRIKAISYWHESWVNDDGSFSNLRLDSSPTALATYRAEIASPFFVTKPVFK